MKGHQDTRKKAEKKTAKPTNDDDSSNQSIVNSESSSDEDSVSKAEASVIDLFKIRPDDDTTLRDMLSAKQNESEEEASPELEQPVPVMWGTTRTPQKKLAKQAQLNIACDMMASDTTAAKMNGGGIPDDPVLRLPYPGSKAMLKIGRRWITSRFKTEIIRRAE